MKSINIFKTLVNIEFAGGGGQPEPLLISAFTMAEILISLTIIGIIAAITLPALQSNINEKVWNTKRKALFSRLTQAISMMPAINGYGVGANDDETVSKATQAFITEGLSKVLKINNVCDNEHLKDCGIPDYIIAGTQNSIIPFPKKLVSLNKFFNINTSYSNSILDYSQLDTDAAAFETMNGESITVYYNPYCSYTYASPENSYYKNLVQPTMCANFVYDLNGLKGPNQVGKDLGFMTAFYPSDTQVVSPMPISIARATGDFMQEPERFCKFKFGDDARAANLEELKSLFVNLFLIHANGYNDGIRAKNKNKNGKCSKVLYFHSGTVYENESFASYMNVYCIK